MSQLNKHAPAAWGTVPMVPVVLALIAGILTADWLNQPLTLPWLIIASTTCLGGLITVIRRSPTRWWAVLGSGLILLSVFSFGAWRFNTGYLPAQDSFFAHHLEQGDFLSGKVENLKPGRSRMRAEVKLSHILRDSGRHVPVSGKLLVYLPPDEQTAQLKAGDEIVLNAEPSEISGPLNPEVFDFRAYAARRGIHHQVFLRSAADWRVARQSGGGIYTIAQNWRRAWFKTFQDHLTGDELAVASALVIGQRDLIIEEVKSAYTDTGAVHVLAVSGLHVGIIFMILTFFLERVLRLNRTNFGRVAIILISVVCIWAFALVSGLSASVQRAAIMFSLLAVGRIAFRKIHVFNTLSVAALVMLIYQPVQLFHVGFQLSFMAIIGIVAFTNYLDRLVYLPGIVARKSWSAISASTGAQLGTLPLSLLYFRQFPAYFMVSGTLVIVFAFATMFLGLLHGFVAGMLQIPVLAGGTGFLLSFVVELQNALIFFFRKLPGALIELRFFDGLSSLLLALSIASLGAYLRWGKLFFLTSSGGLLVLMLIWAQTQVPGTDEGNEMTVFHVSRGTLIDFSSGSRAWSLGEQPQVKDLDFSAGPLRKSLGYTPETTFALDPATDTLLPTGIRLRYPCFDFADSRWLVLDGKSERLSEPDLSGFTHLLVINDLRTKDMPDLTANQDFLIVLDGSIPFYRWEEWHGRAAQSGWKLHITGEKGAFRLPE
ncbi:ComEC family competence protein [Neolewinella aurantiaca]|uniref:ComEC family competence protein n=1 Tax=Neolewinella aurantiaca TaxID=2602767 RepID=A0A5C7FFE0_9BACT|nr:ComEC/Rec2 family competence protein [Neolewinella aurantiaca]TXF89916.1 ComEC family competence protein [Neolewinella aurantiaca]